MSEQPFLGLSDTLVPVPALLEPLYESTENISSEAMDTLVDKLCERRFFEIQTVLVYDSLTALVSASPMPQIELGVGDLQRIREEELIHVELLSQCLRHLAAFPPVQTRSTAMVETELMGFIRLSTDTPRDLEVALHVAMSVELLDQAGWEIIVTLAESIGLAEMRERFLAALQQESRHLMQLSTWYEALLLQQGNE